jgi:hypothetical protein
MRRTHPTIPPLVEVAQSQPALAVDIPYARMRPLSYDVDLPFLATTAGQQRPVASPIHAAVPISAHSHRRTSAGEQHRRAVQWVAAEMLAARVAAAVPASLDHAAVHAVVGTTKGAVILAPYGCTSASPRELHDHLTAGVALHPRSQSLAPVTRLVISLPSGTQPSPAYLQYISCRVSVAIGRDPERHVVACAHLPDVHPPSDADGKAIHPHVHMTVAAFDPETGAHWRCPHLHVVIERELAAINAMFGQDSNACPAVAGGRSLGLLLGPDRLHMESERVDGTVLHASLDNDVIVAAKAAIPVPSGIEHEPPAGLVVTRRTPTAERELTVRGKRATRLLLRARDALAMDQQIACVPADAAVWAATHAVGMSDPMVRAADQSRRSDTEALCRLAMEAASGDATRAYALMAEIAHAAGDGLIASLTYDQG